MFYGERETLKQRKRERERGSERERERERESLWVWMCLLVEIFFFASFIQSYLKLLTLKL